MSAFHAYVLDRDGALARHVGLKRNGDLEATLTPAECAEGFTVELLQFQVGDNGQAKLVASVDDWPDG